MRVGRCDFAVPTAPVGLYVPVREWLHDMAVSTRMPRIAVVRVLFELGDALDDTMRIHTLVLARGSRNARRSQ